MLSIACGVKAWCSLAITESSKPISIRELFEGEQASLRGVIALIVTPAESKASAIAWTVSLGTFRPKKIAFVS
jgi:hypothetical protein